MHVLVSKYGECRHLVLFCSHGPHRPPFLYHSPTIPHPDSPLFLFFFVSHLPYVAQKSIFFSFLLCNCIIHHLFHHYHTKGKINLWICCILSVCMCAVYVYKWACVYWIRCSWYRGNNIMTAEYFAHYQERERASMWYMGDTNIATRVNGDQKDPGYFTPLYSGRLLRRQARQLYSLLS